MIRTHREKVGLIFVGGLIGGRRLSRLSQTREIEFVGVSLAVDFGHDVLIVVITVGRMEMGAAEGRLERVRNWKNRNENKQEQKEAEASD